jgi:uncharacterized protein (DUF488 family)
MILTIGHSTHGEEAFVELLQAHAVMAVADVRTIPRSRRHPHFSREALAERLPARGIRYEHFAGLGGLRKPLKDSPNGGWRHPGFRGYADHMMTPAFGEALERLIAFGETALVAVMCAEARWWQCHRQLVADALVARGIDVRHIMSRRAAAPHELTSFARVSGSQVRYPGLV